jgi:hypothetical protein
MQAVSLDEEHTEMLIKASEGKDHKAQPYAPPMATWSAEASMIATLTDEVRALRYITLAVNSKQKPSPPVPVARPRTAMDKVRQRAREERHRSLVSRVLRRTDGPTMADPSGGPTSTVVVRRPKPPEPETPR